MVGRVNMLNSAPCKSDNASLIASIISSISRISPRFLYGFRFIYPIAYVVLVDAFITLYPDTLVMLSIASKTSNLASALLSISLVRTKEAPGGMVIEYVKKLSSSVGIKAFGVDAINT